MFVAGNKQLNGNKDKKCYLLCFHLHSFTLLIPVSFDARQTTTKATNCVHFPHHFSCVLI